MASLVWDYKLDPTVDLINIHFNKIEECINHINEEIADIHGSCEHTSQLIGQLEQLFQLHFMYEEQLLEGLNFPAVNEQKNLHTTFLKTFESFRLDGVQCHSASFFDNFIKLRLDFISNMNNDTMKICDFIINSYDCNFTRYGHDVPKSLP